MKDFMAKKKATLKLECPCCSPALSLNDSSIFPKLSVTCSDNCDGSTKGYSERRIPLMFPTLVVPLGKL
jgi:hypothetical protein